MGWILSKESGDPILILVQLSSEPLTLGTWVKPFWLFPVLKNHPRCLSRLSWRRQDTSKSTEKGNRHLNARSWYVRGLYLKTKLKLEPWASLTGTALPTPHARPLWIRVLRSYISSLENLWALSLTLLILCLPSVCTYVVWLHPCISTRKACSHGYSEVPG